MTGSAGTHPKLSHADGRRSLRARKASRIETVIRTVCPDIASKELLDIGTGSGIIASYFQDKVASLRSVDVVDERVDTDFRFDLMKSERLPCEDASFDLAISNHVIEHVDDQILHLQEIARVLRPGGFCYLATPNFFWPVEPHFRLPFLAWLPTPALRDSYVRRTRRGARYDASLLTRRKLETQAAHAGLHCRDVSFEVTSTILAEKLGLDVGFTKPLWPAVRGLAPSLVCILERRGQIASVVG
jgi:2-polyprenyl-3-methyl-5-hydroxy-6-metoxy-1,4-benzoquinol methylase